MNNSAMAARPTTVPTTAPTTDPATASATTSATVSATTMLEVLAEPTRRRVVELLAEAPRRAGELAAAVGTSPQSMSNHLRVLLDAGVVLDERLPRDARARVFRLRPQSLAALQAWLDQLQAEWRVQLRSFKQHVEETSR
jgi:DNA-binding transcriptional ArsR family regulator